MASSGLDTDRRSPDHRSRPVYRSMVGRAGPSITQLPDRLGMPEIVWVHVGAQYLARLRHWAMFGSSMASSGSSLARRLPVCNWISASAHRLAGQNLDRSWSSGPARMHLGLGYVLVVKVLAVENEASLAVVELGRDRSRIGHRLLLRSAASVWRRGARWGANGEQVGALNGPELRSTAWNGTAPTCRSHVSAGRRATPSLVSHLRGHQFAEPAVSGGPIRPQPDRYSPQLTPVQRRRPIPTRSGCSGDPIRPLGQ
jgi:hypothetical protein